MRPLPTIALALLAGLALLCGGCPRADETSAGPGGPATSAPVASAAGPSALPAKATTPLDELAPALDQPTSAPVAELPAQARRALQRAEELMKRGNVPAAINLLERSVGYAPNHPRLLKTLGDAYAALPNLGKALNAYEKAAQVDPGDIEVQVLLGDILAGQNRHEEAILAYRRALRCPAASPSNSQAAHALLRLAQLLEKQNYWQAAYDAYTRLGNWLAEFAPTHAARPSLKKYVLRPQMLLLQRARLLRRLRKPHQALALLDDAYRWDRTNLETARLMLATLIETGDYPRAETLIVELADEASQLAQLPALAGELCRASQDPDMPQRIWRACVERKLYFAPLAVALAEASADLGRPRQGLAIVRSSLDSKPDNPRAAGWLVDRYAAENRPLDALQVAGRLLATAPNQVDAVHAAVSRVVATRRDSDLDRQLADLARQDPSSARAGLHYVAGRTAAELGRELLAIDQYQQAVEADSDFLPAYERLVELYIDQRQFDPIDRLIEKMRSAKPDSHIPDYLLAKSLLAQGRPAKALQAVRSALRVNGEHVRSLLLLADIHSRMGNSWDATNALIRARKADEDNPLVYRRLFGIYLANKRYAQAEAQAKALLAQQPDALEPQLMIAEVYLAAGRRDEADALLARLAEQHPPDEGLQLLQVRAELAEHEGLPPKKAFDQAVEKLLTIQQRFPDSRDSQRLLARLFSRPGLYDQAAAMWSQLYQQSSASPDIGRLYAIALMRTGQMDAAVDILQDVLAETGGEPRNLELLTRALAEQDRYDQAIEALETLDPGDNDRLATWRRFRMLELLRQAGDYPRAVELIDDWIKAEDAISETALTAEKLQLMVKAGQIAPAVELTETWARQASSRTGANARRVELVNALAEENAYDRANDLLDEWIGDDPNSAVEALRLRKILLLGQAGRLDQATRYADAWLDQSPPALAPRQGLVAALIEADRPGRALEHIDRWIDQLSAPPATTTAPAAEATTQPATQPAVELAPVVIPTGASETLRWCRIARVRMLIETDRLADALEQINQLIEDKAGEFDELLSLKSGILGEMGQQRQSLEVTEKLYALQPNLPSINNNLGYFYADMGVKLDRAERMIRLALGTMPDAIHIQDSLGWVLYKQGRLGEAAEVFERILDQVWNEPDTERPGLPVIYDHAGDAYYRLGWTDLAGRLWQQALEAARAEDDPAWDIRQVIDKTPAKVEALDQGLPAPVAPLGENVDEPAARPDTDENAL